MKVRTRFAPSPTGNFHIGGARSALFAYLWAKKNGGDFILRIEDTDRAREKEGALENIVESLRWLNIEWDEGFDVGGDYGPYIQSERYDLYTQYANELLEKGKAYRCFCTPERLDEMRKTQQQEKKAPRYDKTCRALSEEDVQSKLDAHTTHVVRLAVPEEGSVEVHDAIRGTITFQAAEIDDQVLVKSDGFPTYHLANVVDDHLMEITHVIRGEEWVPSTPKHVLLYQAFGWEKPVFAHLTVFLSKQGGKMSKRHGDTALLAFREKGYLPEAIVNFIAFLGWNPKTEEEHFTLEELTKRFELSQVNSSNPVFETEKLDWMNQHYMRELSAAKMLERMNAVPDSEQFIEWFSGLDTAFQASIWESMSERNKTLSEVAENVRILNTPTYDAQELIWKKSDAETTKTILGVVIEKLSGLSEEQFLRGTLEPMIIEWIKTTEWGNGDVLWPVRFALSGEQRSPSPFELAEMLGKNETLARLTHAQEQL